MTAVAGEVCVFGHGQALYGQPAQLPADAAGPMMTRLRREHHRLLGNGWCTRPRQLDCVFESSCETCTYFQTSIEARPRPGRPARPRRSPRPDRTPGTLRPARPHRRPPRIMIRLTAITRIMPMSGRASLQSVITCVVEYVIDPAKIAAFERFARRWMELVNLHGGAHHGYFLPVKGTQTVFG